MVSIEELKALADRLELKALKEENFNARIAIKETVIDIWKFINEQSLKQLQ